MGSAYDRSFPGALQDFPANELAGTLRQLATSLSQWLFPRYQYSPLQHSDSLRLLSLRPAKEASPINVTLFETRLQEAGPYEALSYSWATEDGNCDRSSRIRCGSKVIWVTKNCEAGLWRLRNQNSDRIVWVDAICIDQRNDAERGHQVRNMRDVYRSATRTLIWLGEESKHMDLRTNTPDSSLFLQFLSQLAAELTNFESQGRSATSSPLYQQLVHQMNSEDEDGPRSSTPLGRGLWSIIRRRWWERLVNQSRGLSRSIFGGLGAL